MSFRIQNNLAAMNTQNSLETSQTAMEKSLARLSSGYRINSAKDDAAGLAISQGFRANIAAAKVAQRNISEANALLQTAEGAMTNIGDILTRMKELATQASSANVSDGGRTNIDTEFKDLQAEIDRIANSTKYAGTALTTGAFTGKVFMVGYVSDADSKITIGIANIGTITANGVAGLDVGTASTSVASAADALTAMATIDKAVATLSTARAKIGSYQNRLGYAAANLSVTLENMSASDSVIRDVDMAAEMTNFTKNQILVQAGTAMLAQANSAPQQILSLLKG